MKFKSYIPQTIIFVFAFIIYANTLGHQYALDDKMTYWKNEFVQNGISGIKDILTYDSMAGMFGKDSKELEGGRYRPLSLITFAVEVELFGKETTDLSAKAPFKGNPGLSHFINIILYCFSLLILYKVLLKLFRDYKPKYWYLSIPFIATMLFAAHPLHTEAVANIKGRDEILAFLFSVAALNSIINFVDKNKKTELVNAFIFMFLGSLSKEITITFIAVIPICIYFFRKEKVSKYIISVIPLIVGALLYLIIRQIVIGDQKAIEATMLMNNPFLEATIGQRYATVVLTLLIYLKLLIFPHPLTWDYYPYHIPIVDWTDWRVILGLLLYVGLAIVAIKGLKNKSIYSFGILIFAATLSITSNIFFNIGAFMSERFVYVSLLGFCVIIAYLISEKLNQKISHLQKYRKSATTIMIVILLVFSVKTISRNQVWENNLSLFSHDINISVNSAKGNSTYASELYKLSEDAEAAGDTALRNKYLIESIPYFEKAIEIYPDYSEALVRLGNIHYKLYGDYKTMFDYYIKTLKASPLNKDVWSNTMGVLLYNVDEPEYEKYVWTEFAKYSPGQYQSYFQLGNIYYFSQPANADSAIFWYEKAKTLTTSNFEIYFYLGVSYGNKQDFVRARENLLLAAAIKEDAEVYRYLGITYGMENNDEMALKYFEKALILAPNDEQLKQYVLIAKQRMGL
ncbi:MAG TPA: tetratricopeptide repeat protein [Bacteroidales bacterium]|nr:tetratricopeptide repeat protein [Bacteroidales bacterium]